ncbi:MAG: hypothetical protein EOO88_62680, partial [Pedobacter sp.]
MMNKILIGGLCMISIAAMGQTAQKPFIRLVDPLRETNTVRNARQFISGSTCKDCVLTVNGSSIKVYETGGFAAELNLLPGDND